MKFEDALTMVKQGQPMRRTLWPIGRFIYIVPASDFTVNRSPLNEVFEDGTRVHYNARIDEHKANDTFCTWTAPDEDLLAVDWEIFEI